jgi:hypothetical protein
LSCSETRRPATGTIACQPCTSNLDSRAGRAGILVGHCPSCLRRSARLRPFSGSRHSRRERRADCPIPPSICHPGRLPLIGAATCRASLADALVEVARAYLARKITTAGNPDILPGDRAPRPEALAIGLGASDSATTQPRVAAETPDPHRCPQLEAARRPSRRPPGRRFRGDVRRLACGNCRQPRPPTCRPPSAPGALRTCGSAPGIGALDKSRRRAHRPSLTDVRNIVEFATRYPGCVTETGPRRMALPSAAEIARPRGLG